MKILWISQNLPFPPKTGVLQRNYNLLAQAAKFAEIDLVGILKEDILPGFDADLARRELGKLCRSVEVVSLRIEQSRVRLLATVAWSAFSRLPFSVNWATSKGLRDAIRGRLEREHYDVAYFDTISLAQYLDLLPNVPSILNHHNVESHLFERRIAFEPNRLRRAYYRLEAHKLEAYERRICPLFAVNFTVSPLDAERLSAIMGGARTAVVANGVDTHYFSRTSAAADTNKIVMVSGMNWFPNRDAALYFLRDVWPQIAREYPKAKLQVIGASPPEEIVNASREDSRIHVTGFVDDVRPFMSSASVYVCPMRDGGGTRLKILDALSMELPIVATTMAIEGIDLQPERDVLIGDTPMQFARQVVRALREPQLRKTLAANGRAFVEERFSWPVIGAHLRDEFLRLTQKKALQ